MQEKSTTEIIDIDSLPVMRRRVAEMLAEGRSNKEIANRLGISYKAASMHVSRVRKAFKHVGLSLGRKSVIALNKQLKGGRLDLPSLENVDWKSFDSIDLKIIDMLAQGESLHGIASSLGLNITPVRRHLAKIKKSAFLPDKCNLRLVALWANHCRTLKNGALFASAAQKGKGQE
ncbi:MAG: LuxR C-terminal-related transcriptional regulator [bacterium JZ-2024 1]